MYEINLENVQVQLKYSDIFSGDIPNIKKEIQKLNMHKAISIICELIRTRNSNVKTIKLRNMIIDIPFEIALKQKMCNITFKNEKELLADKRLGKNIHIISVQPLLILLKRVIQYGNYNTLNDEYDISIEDYKKIIQLQLTIVEELDSKHMNQEVDMNHFIYSTYHFNNAKNVANEFLRVYYIMEKLNKNVELFEDIKSEYINYYNDFLEKYGITPTEYISLLFCELDEYYSDINDLTYTSIWRNIERKYGSIKRKEKIDKIINILALPISEYKKWAEKTEKQEWEFSKFYEFPFFKDNNANYISVSDITLRNAFFEKLYWLIRDCYSKKDNSSMAFWGRLFEKYVQDITKNIHREQYMYIDEFEYEKGKKSSDVYVQRENKLLAIECKGFSTFISCMTQNKDMEKNIEKLFIKPILQADKALKNIIDGECRFTDIEEIYVISVTMDNINAVPDFYNKVQNKIENNKKCDKIKYYFNFNIEEYEMLMYLMEQGKDVFDILKKYFCEKSLKPFSTYLHNGFECIEMTNFMKEIFCEATNNMKEMVFSN